MTIELTHFSAALLFAVFASVVFGITQRTTAHDQLRYGLYCFAMFVGGSLAGSALSEHGCLAECFLIPPIQTHQTRGSS